MPGGLSASTSVSATGTAKGSTGGGNVFNAGSVFGNVDNSGQGGGAGGGAGENTGGSAVSSDGGISMTLVIGIGAIFAVIGFLVWKFRK